MFSYLNNNKYFLILFIVLLLGIGFSIISLFDNNYTNITPSITPPITPTISNNENYNSNKVDIRNKPKLALYFATWCGHCNTFKPIWNDIKSNHENSQFIDFNTIDCSSDKPETTIHKTFNGTDIDGFPTIILSKNNKDILYQGPRNKKAIEDFIKQHI